MLLISVWFTLCQTASSPFVVSMIQSIMFFPWWCQRAELKVKSEE